MKNQSLSKFDDVLGKVRDNCRPSLTTSFGLLPSTRDFCYIFLSTRFDYFTSGVYMRFVML